MALLNAVRNGWQLFKGLLSAIKHVREERPDAMLTTGGYVAGPVSVAAKLYGVPILTYLPDIEPAQSVVATGRLSKQIAVTVEDSKQYFPEGKAVVTGYPLGERITQWTREQGRKVLGITDELPLLLVFGGSRGARSINRALMRNIEAITEFAQVMHISGTLDWDEVRAFRETLPEQVKAHYIVHAYLHENMGAALASADLVLSRSGAGTLGEFTYFGLPSILVPYPYAWRYQKVNADWLADRGAALVLRDEDLAAKMTNVIRDVMQNTDKRDEMAKAAHALSRPQSAQVIAQHLIALATGG